MSAKLSRSTLANLPAGIIVPNYDPGSLKAGILHIGIGNFHRAHQAVYLDDLFRAGRDLDWAIIGAGVRATDEAMRENLCLQDWLTTIVEQEAQATHVRVIGSMVGFVPPGNAAAVLEALARPEIRIVSLTITEGGYYISPATQQFDAAHPDIVDDAQHINTPRSAFGLIVAGLMRRRAAGIPPFAVMSCDNIPGNGHVTQNAVVGLAELVDAKLAQWIKSEVAFPNSMVDRITPATSGRERVMLRDNYGIEDASPVFCEEFRQWVMEDHFPAGRPALESVGVTFTSDVALYEVMKIRILNGGHATIGYPAALLDIHFVHEAMEDAQIRAFLKKLTRDEIIPTVSPPPGVQLEEYRQLIERRFSNPKIGDTVSRLCLDGSNRQPKFILPTVADRLKAHASVRGLALVSALWCRYCAGETESGKAIAANDPNWERINTAARAARHDATAFLAMHDIFGALADDARYIEAFADALSMLWSKGVRASLEHYLSTSG